MRSAHHSSQQPGHKWPGIPAGNIEVRPSEAGTVLPSMFLGFFSLLALVLGAAAAAWPAALAGALGLAGALFLAWYFRRCRIVLEEDHLTVSSPFSVSVCRYGEADLLLLRRSRVRHRWSAGTGLQDVGARLQKEGRILATIPVSWQNGQGYSEALAFLERLPIPKKYL